MHRCNSKGGCGMIEKLVADLPEVYQPIYGHPELSGHASRSCADRLEEIARVHDAMHSLLGRPIRVLDLGCAQGYFSLNLAARGAVVTGVDFFDRNTAVCNALASENAALQVSFKTARVEDTITDLQPLQYDLVLGLSVFHHIVYEKGADAVKALLEHAAAKSGLLLLEIALREEPLYWGPAQPEDPQFLLEGIAYVHELGRYGTHLAPVARPLFVASNRYWVFGDLADSFNHWSSDSHALAPGVNQGSRRYFFGVQTVLKTYRFDHQFGLRNIAQFEAETGFLRAPPSGFNAPRLIAYGRTDKAASIIVEKLPGRLLLDMLREGSVIDSRVVLLRILQQLVLLEDVGLYHDDVRTWNVLVSEDGVPCLIDFGSISNKAEDCVWPRNVYLSFFIFVREVVTGVVDNPVPLRTIAISPFGLPQPYRAWIMAFWTLPLPDWSFKRLYQLLLANEDRLTEAPSLQPLDLWIRAIEEALQAHVAFGKAILSQHQDRVNQAEAKAQQAEVKAQQAKAKAEQAEAKADNYANELVHIATQLNAFHESLSWRLTIPLRYIARQLNSFIVILRRFGNAVVRASIDVAKRPIGMLIKLVLRSAKLRQRINRWLSNFPGLHQQLLGIARSQGIESAVQMTHSNCRVNPSAVLFDVKSLSPREQEIYEGLKKAIANSKNTSCRGCDADRN